MDNLPASTSVNTFIVRIWLEWSESGSCWRGQVLHVQSGNKAAFLTQEEMIAFIRDYVAMPFRKNNPKKGKAIGNNNF